MSDEQFPALATQTLGILLQYMHRSCSVPNVLQMSYTERPERPERLLWLASSLFFLATFLASIVSGRTEQKIRDRKQETGNRKQVTERREKEFRKDVEKGYEFRLTFRSSIVSGRTEQEIRDRKQETGNRKQETGNRKQVTECRKKEFRKDIEKGYELRLTFLSSIDSEQEIRKRKQETGNRKQNRKKEFRKDNEKGYEMRL